MSDEELAELRDLLRFQSMSKRLGELGLRLLDEHREKHERLHDALDDGVRLGDENERLRAQLDTQDQEIDRLKRRLGRLDHTDELVRLRAVAEAAEKYRKANETRPPHCLMPERLKMYAALRRWREGDDATDHCDQGGGESGS